MGNNVNIDFIKVQFREKPRTGRRGRRPLQAQVQPCGCRGWRPRQPVNLRKSQIEQIPRKR